VSDSQRLAINDEDPAVVKSERLHVSDDAE
jgi:hypothetical protein